VPVAVPGEQPVNGKRVQIAVRELAPMLDIERLLARLPQGLSDGGRQRVALGRALAFRPSVLCLDKPLSALDHSTREQMYALLASARSQTGVTVLHVTHSRVEAHRLADKRLRLHDGRVVCERSDSDVSSFCRAGPTSAYV